MRPATHVSQDVDVLVHPDELARLVSALEAANWRRVPESNAADIDERHSVQLTHSHLGLEVDIHYRYPGFATLPSEAFEALWARRRARVFAAVECPATDGVSAYLIELLHLARDPDMRRARLRALLAYSDVPRGELIRLVRDTGAVGSVAPYLPDAVGASGTDTFVVDDRWALRAAIGRATAAPAVFELSRAPWRRRPGIIWRLMWMPREHLYRKYPDLADARLGAMRAALRRWRVGLKSLPSARRRLREAESQASGSGVRP